MNSKNSQNGIEETFLEKVLKTSATESDSVHPRFAPNPSEKELQEYHKKYDFFCVFCKMYFAPTLLGLVEHFKPGRIDHIYTKSCIYCKGPVYEYSKNEKVRIYHNCAAKEEDQ